jgi:hypothetical protein
MNGTVMMIRKNNLRSKSRTSGYYLIKAYLNNNKNNKKYLKEFLNKYLINGL